nr:hypothetical protein [Tanacetum cinerariifolium]
MALTFTDTHNMIAYLTKSNTSEGFEQIIDFLNASLIQYALTVNPNIYVSCIKQFWSSVSVKKTNDVVLLQALIDRKKVIITEDTVRQALRLDDAENIDCLPNEEIFTELARMCSSMASAVICLATGRKFNFSKYIFDSLVRNVDSSSKFYMYPRFLQLIIRAQVGDLSSHTTKYSFPALTQKVFANMRRVGKGFSRVETPLFERMLVQQQAADDTANIAADEVIVDDVADVVAHAIAEPTQPLPIPTTTPSPPQDHPSTSHVVHTPPLLIIAPPSSRGCIQTGGIIADLDADKNAILEEVDVTKDVKVAEDADVQGRLEESQAQVYHIDLEHADKVLSMQDDETEPTELQEVIKAVTTAKLMTKVVTGATTTITAAPIAAATITAAPSAARRRKGVVIRDPEETATPLTIIHSDPKSKDKGKGIMVIRKEKEDNVVLRYHALKRKPQTKAQARKNMIVYLKNMAGFKMDYFKGMSYDDIRPIFEKYFNSNVAFLEKTEEKLEEEVPTHSTTTSPSQLTLALASTSSSTALSHDDAMLATMKQITNLLSGNIRNTGYRGNQKNGQGINNKKKVICYNYRGKGHVARQCKEPKRPKDSLWHQDKAMLLQAKENDLDDEPNAAAAFMANLSSSSSQINEVRIFNNNIFETVSPSWPSEVPQDEYLDSDEDSVHEDNTILYDQYLATKEKGHHKVNQEKDLVNATLSAELDQCKLELARLECNKVKLEYDQLIVARNKRNAKLEQETELLQTTLRNKEATIASLTSETKTVLSEKKTLEDKYLEEIV